MRIVFKASIGILVAAAVGGQAWVHQPASREFVSQMKSISRMCPSIAVRPSVGKSTKAQAIMLRDAYWRIKLADRVAAIAGESRDGCFD